MGFSVLIQTRITLFSQSLKLSRANLLGAGFAVGYFIFWLFKVLFRHPKGEKMRFRLLLGLVFLVGCGGTADFVEIEPNNTPGQAKSVGTPSIEKPIAVGAAINPVGDVDFFKFTISAVSDVKLQTFDKTGSGCKDVDTVLELIDQDGVTSLAVNDDVEPFVTTCSLIDADTSAGAQKLAPGEYFAKVTPHDGAALIPSYQVKISIISICGDNTQQGSEACDDGNTSNNDGCSQECRAELCGNNIIDNGEQCDNGKECTDLSPCANDVECVGVGDGSCLPRAGDTCDESCQNEGSNIVCGDGVKEGSEQCDDGNLSNGDGCSANCIVENAQCGDSILQDNEECDDGALATGDGCNANCLNEPGHFGELEPNDGTGLFQFKDVGTPTVVIHGAIKPATDIDVYRFTVPVTADVRIEVFDGDPNLTGCFGVDSAIELIAPNGITILASDDEDSDAFCSVIDSGNQASANGIVPGEYFVRIREFGSDEIIDKYQIKISFNALCGDGLTQGSEGCDDGGTTPEDGCSENCQIEPGNFFEIEPNNGAEAKTIENGLPDVLIHGEINPLADIDNYRINLLAPTTIRFQTFDATGASCVDIDTLVSIFGVIFDQFAGQFVLLPIVDPSTGFQLGDDDSGVFRCSDVTFAFPAGSFLVQVSEFGNDETIDGYTMSIDFP
jgi:cysteine-rich repeat protein